MIKILVVTLGKHGESLIDATDHIIGRSDSVSYLTVDWTDNLASVKTRLSERIDALNQGSGVLLLTDIFGSTATNVSLEQAVPGVVEVVTGVNLPMIIKASTLDEGISLAEAANVLRNQGRKAISIAGEML
jgi:PTS system mannose-specific IIA component